MAGLLDLFNSDQGRLGIGLLAAAGPSTMGVGERFQSVMQGMDAHKRAQAQQKLMDLQMQTGLLGLEKAKRDASTEAQMADAARRYYTPAKPGMGLLEGALPPELRTGAAPVPGQPAGFDLKGYANELMGIDPLKGLAFQQSLAKDTPFSKVDPKDYTQDSVARFAQTRNFADLVPVRKREVAPNGQVFDPYQVQPGAVFADPNKPFSIGPNGPVANLPFQQFEVRKALASKPTIENKVEMVTETEWAKKRAGANADLMEQINKSAFSAPNQVRKLERLEQLLEGVDGGKLAPTGLEIASAANSLGIKIDPKLGNKEAAQALSREIAGGFRQPGTGPMTDKDFENFLLQVPDLSKTAAGRRQITATMKAAAARDIEIGKRAREYVKKNGRLDDNFLDEVSQFVAENPVIQMPKGWQVQR